MTQKQTLVALVSAFSALALVSTTGCSGTDSNGTPDAGPQLQTGIYTATDARNVVDGCNTQPTGLAGTQYLIDVDAGFVQFFGTTTAQAVGTPPQPAQGQGTLTANGEAQLLRDNDTSSGACNYHLNVVNAIFLNGQNSFTSGYRRTETQHTGPCPTDHPDGCVTTFNWDLTKP